MNLTLHADISLRILLYLTEHRDRPVSTQEISEAYGISRNHLVRVAQTCAYRRIRSLTRPLAAVVVLRLLAIAEINMGEVIRKTEPSFRIVECFQLDTNTCRITPICKLRGVLGDALKAFIQVLDAYTLADVARMEGIAPLSNFLAIQRANLQPSVRTRRG